MTVDFDGWGGESIRQAVSNLQGVVQHTPLLPARDLAPDINLYLKAENLQRTHAFKFRGAYHRVSRLVAETESPGVIAASSGNHALGVALAASLHQLPAKVVMPTTAPDIKAIGCQRYGAEVLRVGANYDEALTYAKNLASETKWAYIESFDDATIISGQASVGWEILQDLPDVEVIVAPIGGGGLISGLLALTQGTPDSMAKRFFPKRKRPLSEIEIIGVEAEGAASMRASYSSGQRTELSDLKTEAEGIAVRRPGALTFRWVHQFATDIVTVSDLEMWDMVVTLLTKEKLLVEAAGAAAPAAVMAGKSGFQVCLADYQKTKRAIVCILSGGNLEMSVLQKHLARFNQSNISKRPVDDSYGI